MARKYGQYYIPNRWAVSMYCFDPEVRASMNLPKKLHVRDTTMREGNEQPGVFMPPEVKVKIAEKLVDAGITEAELGYPGADPEQERAIRMIKKEFPNLQLSAFARSWIPDWKRDVDIVVASGADAVDILNHPVQNWASDKQMMDLGCPREQFFSRLVEVIEYAKTTGKRVMYAHCDALEPSGTFLSRYTGW